MMTTTRDTLISSGPIRSIALAKIDSLTALVATMGIKGQGISRFVSYRKNETHSPEVPPVVTGTETDRDNVLQLYPNPARDVVFIDGEKNAYRGYSLYGADGRLIREANDREIDLRNLRSGFYLVRMRLAGNTFVTRRLIRR